MRKTIIKSIIAILIINIFMIKNTFAASAGIYSTDKTVTSGKENTVTVTVCSSQLLSSYAVQLVNTGGLTLISASGGTVSPDNKKVTSASVEGVKNLANYTFKVPDISSQQNYTVTFELSILEGPNNESYENVTNKATITVNPKEQSGGSNTGGSGNSGSQDKPNESNVPSESNNNKPKQEVTKSSNNSLKELSIGTGKLTPDFSRDTYEYSVEFDDTVNLYDLSEIEVSATAEDEKASVSGTGKIQLTEGENNIAINVTAENGAVRTYTIKVNKPQKVEQSALRLKTLVLNGINENGEYQTINFELNPETFEYNLKIPNNIKSISINPTTENEDIIIETNGGENLNDGQNKIIIILTSPSDDTIKTTYTLNIERETAIVEEQGISKQQMMYIAIAIALLVIILIIIIVAIIKHRRKKKLFDYDEEDDDVQFENKREDQYFENNEINPYPEKIRTKEINDETETKLEELQTTDDVEPAKLKWDDFCKGYEEEQEQHEKTKKEKKKNKGGKRFL